MKKPGVYNFPVQYKGNNGQYPRIEVLINNVPIDLTNTIIKMEIKRADRHEKPTLVFQTGDGIEILDAVNGLFKIEERKIDIPAWSYVYDIKFFFPDGTEHTYVRGNFIVTQNITK